MNKQELMDCLARCGMHPGKVLGQNFLLDGNLLDYIVRTAAPPPGEVVLEVGPGFGALTAKLLAAGVELYSIEFDHRICEFLRTGLAAPNFHLIEGDACRVDLRRILPPEREFRAIANLPYAISSVFITRLLDLERPPELMIFMLQKEMGQRLAAPAGKKNYGALSVRTQLLYDVKMLRIVSPRVFYPPPGVDSALVCFERKKALPDLALRRRLGAVARTAFAQRRKQLQKVLCGNFPSEQVKAAFQELGLKPEVRPEALPVETFAALAAQLSEVRK